MKTFLAANTTRMTTGQLIYECAEQGITVTVTKLARWVREGLIPNSLRQRHGLGQGNGTEWLWDAECLPRAVIIGRSLNNDRSLLHAARALAEIGYAPTPSVLSDVLLDCIVLYERSLTIRQTYIGSAHPQEEQYKRFMKHMRRKTPDMPDTTFAPFTAYIAALLGLIPEYATKVPEIMKQIQNFLSLFALKERIQTMDGSLLVAKYEDAGRMIPEFVPLIVGIFNELLLPFAKQLQEKRGQDTTAFPPNIDLQMLQKTVWEEGGRNLTSNLAVGRLRLYLTIFFIALPPESETLAQWATMLLNLISNVSEYLGFPPHSIANVLEASKKNNSE